MTIAPGTKLGRYEIRSKIGQGGMGEVYLAEDLRLHRKVALKILPVDLATNQDRMRRFEKEATAAAALNHPNIAHIYEVGEAEGTPYIAMEFIDGVTLRELIHGGQTELAKLLRYLQHAAEGLAKAHAAGIIHRDLKPDNIMVTRDGHAKVLDFGLVKLIEPPQSLLTSGGSASEIATALMAQPSAPGMVMGTVGYMSPEQAQGKTAHLDHRSDIFSFGCIIYEAVTRRKAFEGKDAIDSLNKIIREQPTPISNFNPEVPSDLQRIVRRCLAKDPDERYQTIKDVAIEIKESRRELQDRIGIHRTTPPPQTRPGINQQIEGAGSTEESPATSLSPSALSTHPSSAEYIVNSVKKHKFGAIVVLALFVIALAGTSYGVYKLTGKRDKSFISFQSAKIMRLTTSGKVTDAAISPDGKYAAHVIDDTGKQSLWVRQVATQSNVEIVPPAEVKYEGLTFSPDGNYVYYTVEEKGTHFGILYEVPSLGGAPRKVLADVVGKASLSPDGKQLVYLTYSFKDSEDILMIVNVDGSSARRLAGRRGNEHFYRGVAPGVSWSPDGKTIATPAGFTSPENYMTVVAVSVDTGELKYFTPQKWTWVNQVAWLADGSGVLVTGLDESNRSHIWHVSYPDGAARLITNDLNNYLSVSLDANSNGLVTVQAERMANIFVAPANDTSHLTPITSGRHFDYGPSWAPDGALVYDSDADGKGDLYLTDSHGRNPRQLTANSNFNIAPAVSPDGRYIVFESGRTGGPHIWRMDIDGSNPKELTDQFDFDAQWSPDGQWIVYQSNANNRQAIRKVSFSGGQSTQLNDEGTFADTPALSPDGKQVACYYQTDPNGPAKLAIVPIAGGPPTKTLAAQVTVVHQTDLRWTPDGRSIVYVVTRGGVSNLWAEPVDGSAARQLTNFTTDLIFAFDFSRDAKQLALSRGTRTSDVILISNFKQ